MPRTLDAHLTIAGPDGTVYIAVGLAANENMGGDGGVGYHPGQDPVVGIRISPVNVKPYDYF
jgi:hypothetical protein